MKKALFIIISIGVAHPAIAEIYKCKSNSQRTIYTDQPCTESQIISIQSSAPSSLAAKPHASSAQKQENNQFLSKQEMVLLNQIKKREQSESRLDQWKEKQQYKQKLKQLEQKNKQHKVRGLKCDKHKKNLKMLEDQARSGYSASESNNIKNEIRREKSSISKYCD